MVRALLIIRTPLQARLAEIALAREQVREYDLLYLTRRRTPKTIRYFHLLAHGARSSSLIYVPEWFFGGFAELVSFFWGRWSAQFWGGRYDLAVFGSLDSLAITGLATRFAPYFITVDDGVANILPTGPYSRQRIGRSDWFVRRMSGAPSLNEVKNLVARHYTVLQLSRNAIETKKLIPVSNWPPTRISMRSQTPIVIYISGAESMWASSSQLREIREYLLAEAIHFYVPHPMDKHPTLPGVPELPHSELLAEEALAILPGNHPLHLIGTQSTALFTTRKIASKRTMLIPKRSKSLIPAARESGCEIVELRE